MHQRCSSEAGVSLFCRSCCKPKERGAKPSQRGCKWVARLSGGVCAGEKRATLPGAESYVIPAEIIECFSMVFPTWRL